MAVHRTREDKMRAEQHRMQGAGSAPSFKYSHSGSVSRKNTQKPDRVEVDMGVCTRQDLTRTFIVSLILLIILVGIFQYLRYNG